LQEIIPKKYLLAMGSEGFKNAPIGTGPFRFVRLESENLILRRFEEYYGGAPANPPVQKAPIEQLVFRTVPLLTNRIAMLKKGEGDIITHVSPEVLPILKLVPQIRVLSRPATRSYFAELNVMKYPFSDLRFRQALNYGFDVQGYIDLFLKGHGTVLPTVLLPNAFAYHDTLKPYPYNPKLAKKLIHDADFPEWYTITINCAEQYRQFANSLAILLSKMGLHPSVNIMQKADARLSMTRLLGDILVTSWGNSTLDPVGIIMPKFKSTGRGNFSNYNNKEVDALLSQAENTLDFKKRENYYKRIQEIIYKDTPMIFGYAAEEFYVIRERVKNFIPSSSGMMNMHDVYIENGK
jgi:peptide/nickel transport system substrate-binding protein